MLFLAAGTPARAASDGPTDAAVVMLSKKKSPRDLSAAMSTRICARSAVNAEPMWLLTPTTCGTLCERRREQLPQFVRRLVHEERSLTGIRAGISLGLHGQMEDHFLARGVRRLGRRLRGRGSEERPRR